MVQGSQSLDRQGEEICRHADPNIEIAFGQDVGNAEYRPPVALSESGDLARETVHRLYHRISARCENARVPR